MAIANGDVLRIVCKMSYGTDMQQNVYHALYTGSTELDDTVFDEILDWMDDLYTIINGYVAASVNYDTIEVFCVTQDRPISEDAWPALTVGASTYQPLPPQVAALALFPTATARSQGRKFLPSFAENCTVGDGIIDAVPLGQIATYVATAILGRVAGAGFLTLGNWNPDLARFAEWIAGIASDQLATQRRRRLGYGE